MAASALLSGMIGDVLSRNGMLSTDWLMFTDSPARRYRFMAKVH
jgi:hypothetical protein